MDGEAVGRVFLEGAVETFAATKALGDGVLRQLSEEEMRRVVGPDFNSVAVIVKHMRGNMLSRWTEFLTSDGEKHWRDRDGEFVDDGVGRDEVLNRWEEGWAAVFGALGGLRGVDVGRTVTIRGQAHTVARAVMRQVEHYGYHVGQMVLIGKTIKGEGWETLTVARGGSGALNRSLGFEAGGERRSDGAT